MRRCMATNPASASPSGFSRSSTAHHRSTAPSSVAFPFRRLAGRADGLATPFRQWPAPSIAALASAAPFFPGARACRGRPTDPPAAWCRSRSDGEPCGPAW